MSVGARRDWSPPWEHAPLTPSDDELSVARDADRRCRVCEGRGWHWGWIQRTGDPVKLRCPCVDEWRAAAPKEPPADRG